MARTCLDLSLGVFLFGSIAVLLWQVYPSLLGGLGLSLLESTIRDGPYAARYGSGTHWNGWAGVEQLFIFGDSWTTNGFEVDGAQPSLENPLGNPPWDPAHWHLGAGSNWVGFITAVHNQSLLRTFNLAKGGATVDKFLIHPFPEVPLNLEDFKFQVDDLFIPTYASQPPAAEWEERTSLFAIWIGLNDIHNAHPESPFGKVIDEYTGFVDELYQSGARNFLFINVPAIERSPLASVENKVEDWKSWILAWNQNITDVAKNLSHTYDDVTAFVFDTYLLFNNVIDDPCSHPESCAFKDTTTFCPDYVFGTDEWNSSKPNCNYRVDEYLWMNDVHPTTRMHNLTAREIANALMEHDN